ncbi:NADP-dependent oxidoreductase [Motiliproteus sp.]|uniref:NADP-dependent oxidoreductase n=1 Tax=Motiliproteus sp. TaxID=1898955 RepID=UPI003BA954A5
MLAIRLHQFGGVEQLQAEQLESPVPGAGEVLIDLVSAGVNPIDWKTREGGGAAPFQGEPPLTLGWECAGTVHSLGEGVSGLAVGDRVCGLLNFPEPGRCYAEQTLAKQDQLARVADSIELVECGGLPLAGLTAWQALFEAGKLQPGQRVLILAAAGGVGHLAVQLAKWKGAEVIGTASAANREFLQQLGCDRVIDYRNEEVTELIRDVDLILDGMGGQTGVDVLACLKPGGVSVTLPSVTAAQVIEAAEARGCEALSVRVSPNGEQLAQLLALVEQGALRLAVDKIVPLRQVAQAHQHSESGRTRGKIILRV